VIDDLQILVDGLAASLGRTVYLDDRDFGLLAYSAHLGRPDAARLEVLSNRGPTDSMREHLRSVGATSSTAPVIVGADTRRGLDYPRLCVPLMSRSVRLGYLWIDLITPTSPTESREIEEAARGLLAVLVRGQEALMTTVYERRELARGVIAQEPGAEQRVRAAGYLRGTGPFVTIVIKQEYDPGEETDAELSLTELASHALWMLPRQGAIEYIDATEAILLVETRPRLSSTAAREIGEGICRDSRIRGYPPVRIGVGRRATSLEDVADSVTSARLSIEVARRVNREVVVSGDHPDHEIAITSVRPRATDDPEMPEILHRLCVLMTVDDERLLREFLRSGCNVAKTATSLHLHRATVYQRLRRLQALSGVDLSDGGTLSMLYIWAAMRL
jgi:hypothetical protein